MDENAMKAFRYNQLLEDGWGDSSLKDKDALKLFPDVQALEDGWDNFFWKGRNDVKVFWVWMDET